MMTAAGQSAQNELWKRCYSTISERMKSDMDFTLQVLSMMESADNNKKARRELTRNVATVGQLPDWFKSETVQLVFKTWIKRGNLQVMKGASLNEFFIHALACQGTTRLPQKQMNVRAAQLLICTVMINSDTFMDIIGAFGKIEESESIGIDNHHIGRFFFGPQTLPGAEGPMYTTVTHRASGTSRSLPFSMQVAASDTYGCDAAIKIQGNGSSRTAKIMMNSTIIPMRTLFKDVEDIYEPVINMLSSPKVYEIMKSLSEEPQFSMEQHIEQALQASEKPLETLSSNEKLLRLAMPTMSPKRRRKNEPQTLEHLEEIPHSPPDCSDARSPAARPSPLSQTPPTPDAKTNEENKLAAETDAKTNEENKLETPPICAENEAEPDDEDDDAAPPSTNLGLPQA